MSDDSQKIASSAQNNDGNHAADTPHQDGEVDPASLTNPVVPQVIAEMKAPLANVPWTLQQFFNGELDLDGELIRRFPTMPLMSTIHFRDSTQDGAAMLMVDVNGATRSVQFSFTYGSMLTMRFLLDNLSDMDRTRWLELMRRERGGLAFLWSEARWKKDYLICIVRRYYTCLLAFSPNNIEAGARLTPDMAHKLVNWLEDFWKPEPPPKNPSSLSNNW
jgi:hypothetical protein